MNFDLFCKKQGKKVWTAITFVYDVEKMRLIYQKKTREKKGARFHLGLPGELFLDPRNSKRKKSYFKKNIFFYKIKKILQKFKKLKKFNFFEFVEFLDFLKFSGFFWFFEFFFEFLNILLKFLIFLFLKTHIYTYHT